jgi:hypothetical protein
MLEGKHWVLTGERNGEALPDVVIRRWAWFKKHARGTKRNYIIAEVISVVGAAAVPVLASLRVDPSLSAAAGAVVLIATAMRTTFGFHDDWIDFSRLRFDIEREAAAFLYSASPYDVADDEATRLLVVRVDDWSDAMRVGWSRRRRLLGSVGGQGHGEPAGVTPKT